MALWSKRLASKSEGSDSIPEATDSLIYNFEQPITDLVFLITKQ